MRPLPDSPPWAAVLALLFNALLWGCAWWPFRCLQEAGVHPLWSTAAIQAFVAALIMATGPSAAGQLARTPVLWGLAITAGITSAACNWSLAIGDVVRVVLLANLAPLWTALLARWLLGEPLGAGSWARVALSLTGAMLLLRPEVDPALPEVHGTHLLAEALGLVGGIASGMSNVFMRKVPLHKSTGIPLAIAAGGLFVSVGLLATLPGDGGGVPRPTLDLRSVMLIASFGLALFAGGKLMRYGVTRLSANAIASVMLNEVMFAGLSSLVLGVAHLTVRLSVGAAMILAGSLLALQTGRARAPLNKT